MCGHRRFASCLLAVLMASCAGCQGTGPRRSAPEPGLSAAIEPGESVVEAPRPRTISYVDRHPVLSKPREYWESSGNNTIVKAAAATFVGVPVGLFGEVRQIVVGSPPDTR